MQKVESRITTYVRSDSAFFSTPHHPDSTRSKPRHERRTNHSHNSLPMRNPRSWSPISLHQITKPRTHDQNPPPLPIPTSSSQTIITQRRSQQSHHLPCIQTHENLPQSPKPTLLSSPHILHLLSSHPTSPLRSPMFLHTPITHPSLLKSSTSYSQTHIPESDYQSCTPEHTKTSKTLRNSASILPQYHQKTNPPNLLLSNPPPPPFHKPTSHNTTTTT
ncbi:hypothetical protein KC19_VG174100 [Ceratodon purpureus]|uniref:Uncharacterized protein n=1 Tax=Ceratodon purpureus TaxID=3225 RepID=A0A8T0HRC0_CERPU|nr:hypothetical protein KC19_VG174100 [Ceratodon purpureus]